MAIEDVEGMVIGAIRGKSANFKLAYALAYQLAGSGMGASARPAQDVLMLFNEALKTFESQNHEEGQAG